MFVGSGRIYRISKLSSDHSGEYKCKSINAHGENTLMLWLYTIMWVNDGLSNCDVKFIMDVFVCFRPHPGTSQCLWLDLVKYGGRFSDSDLQQWFKPTCSELIWFKENQSSAVGSGQSFSALQSGHFYCEAHNQHGSQRSDGVTVTVKGRAAHLLFLKWIKWICSSALLFCLCCRTSGDLYISIGVVCEACSYHHDSADLVRYV